MNMKQKSLSLAVAAVTATLGSMGASAATFDRPNAETNCFNNYAEQTVASQNGKVVRYPTIHDDVEFEQRGGESMLWVEGRVEKALVGFENAYIRIDLENAKFNGTLDDDDIVVEGAQQVNITEGGGPDETFVIYTVVPGLEIDGFGVDDDAQFRIDLDEDGAGLMLTEEGVEVRVRYRLYDTLPGAQQDLPDTLAWDKSQCLADTDNDGLMFMEMLDKHDPVASVRCKGGFEQFYIGEMHKPRNMDRQFHGSTARPYSCFIYKGRQNFGSFEIITKYLNANDGERTRPRDLFELDGGEGGRATVKLSDELGWVDEDDAYAINYRAPGAIRDSFPFCGYGVPRAEVSVAAENNSVDLGRSTRWIFPNNQTPENNEAFLFVGNLNPFWPGWETGEGKWNVCLDDWPGDPRDYNALWEVEYDYPTIPLKDGLQVTLNQDAGVMIQTDQGPRWSTEFNETLTINGIDRNGMVVRFPILVERDDNNQKIILTNRGFEDAEYKLFATTVEGETADVLEEQDGQGVIPAGHSIVLKTNKMVDFSDGRGAGIIVIAGLPQYIDAAELLTGPSGDKTVVNVTTDEGYNGGFGEIINSEDE